MLFYFVREFNDVFLLVSFVICWSFFSISLFVLFVLFLHFSKLLFKVHTAQFWKEQRYKEGILSRFSFSWFVLCKRAIVRDDPTESRTGKSIFSLLSLLHLSLLFFFQLTQHYAFTNSSRDSFEDIVFSTSFLNTLLLFIIYRFSYFDSVII